MDCFQANMQAWCAHVVPFDYRKMRLPWQHMLLFSRRVERWGMDVRS